ncbi:RluA family pseudouridine synthase [Schlegelella sp. S2-27]|uniref:Pseudouridine synthase n=1 Tax=Caldimonas mangrovi TaxID=2944811 RepID=A0ABT0YQH6_9BURK|nr:RluA family pseudouridine synthase [Caldimonas mangrovi]MCM5681000.1 RluA family pseudouridine synthase [Caldimonas mangrovi]
MLPPDRPGAPEGLDTEAEEDQPDAAAVERREVEVGIPQHGLRLDKLLVEIAGEFSRSHLQHLIDEACVQVDGRVTQTASRKVHVGQRVVVELRPTPESRAFRPEAIPLDVRFEDEHLLVLHKPAGLVVHPAAGHWSGTLLNGLLAHHAAAARLPRAGVVHRLDKDTSGLMVVGKTLEAVTQLVRAIAAREVRREYLAVAQGEIRQPAALATIEAPIGRDPQSRVRMAVVAGGKPARTEVVLVAASQGCSAVLCKLHTGRTHQIRVHLAARGFPLIGDPLYGGRPALGMQRQALHAFRLGLAHPVTGEPLAFEAAPPDDFALAWATVAGATV